MSGFVTGGQHRKHDGLRDPLNPARVLTPNEMYAVSVAVTGYVAVPQFLEDQRPQAGFVFAWDVGTA